MRERMTERETDKQTDRRTDGHEEREKEEGREGEGGGGERECLCLLLAFKCQESPFPYCERNFQSLTSCLYRLTMKQSKNKQKGRKVGGGDENIRTLKGQPRREEHTM